MSGQVLEKLFNSPIKVKLLKLFLRNEGSLFSTQEMESKTQLKIGQVRKEIGKLRDINFVKIKMTAVKEDDGKRAKKVARYGINRDFVFYPELKSLILKSSPASEEKMKKNIKKTGRIRLLMTSGLFIDNEMSRIDMMVVGDGINSKKFNNFLRDLESETGKELRYVVLTTEEFNYRMSMFDRFLRDVLDYPHRKLINRLGI
jgi:hypothetical protein